MNQEKRYVRVDENGVYRVGDTRVMLDSVLAAFHQGHSPETIQQQYPALTLEDVYGSITFYLAHQEEVNAYLQRQQVVWDNWRALTEQKSSPVFERIRASRMARRYPLNAVGDFYVADGMCIACTAPEHEAPDLMAHDTEAHAGYHCYFKRQPSTPEELQQAIMAVVVACCGAVRYGGTDPSVLRQLAQCGSADTCDHLADPGVPSDAPL